MLVSFFWWMTKTEAYDFFFFFFFFFYVRLGGWSVTEKYLEVIQFPHLLWATKTHKDSHTFINLHVTHLSRPTLEKCVPADCRLNVKNVFVEELVGVKLCSPVFSDHAKSVLLQSSSCESLCMGSTTIVQTFQPFSDFLEAKLLFF